MSGRSPLTTRRSDEDPVTERDPETQDSDVAVETEDQANQPGRLAGTLLMFRDLWRLIRGEDERGRERSAGCSGCCGRTARR